jgi:Leucine-rich repeat (LRR) protein
MMDRSGSFNSMGNTPRYMKYRFFLVAAAVVLIGAGCSSQPQDRNKEINTNAPVAVTGTRLDISGQGLTELPKSVLQRTDLTELDISNNRLTGALPAEIRMLSKLKILNASNNAMTGVPAEIGQLQNLEALDLSNNDLTGLPSELGDLKYLKTLNLSGNNYSVEDLAGIRAKLPATVKIILQ